MNKFACKECLTLNTSCSDKKKCESARKSMESYQGIRFTADGFDCALPVTVDSHSYCSYECLYCFSDNLQSHIKQPNIKQTKLSQIESIFNGQGGQFGENVRKALRYDKRNEHGYPCPVQLGGLCDPCDTIELNQGWLLDFMKLAIKYRQPVRMSTKGNLFLLKQYQDVIKQAPELFWIAFSIITNEDDVIEKVDKFAPNTTERIKTMKSLSNLGAKTSLRLRPIIQGITDRNNNYIKLIKRCADAGAKAISYEVAFYPQRIPKTMKHKYNTLDKIIGYSFRDKYKSFGKIEVCSRPSYLWTENIMHSIKEITLQEGLTVGVSDPVWKQLSDTGCCCGILPDDEVFGNWEIENCTNTLIKARDGYKDGYMYVKDIIPQWSYNVLLSKIVNLGAGGELINKRKYWEWSDKLKDIWNNPKAQRSPFNYFQGAMIPTDKRDEDGNVIYIYKGLQRQHKRTEWNVFNQTIVK